MAPSRRALLGACGAALGGGLSGCAALVGEPSRTGTATGDGTVTDIETPTTTTTPPKPTDDDLRFEVSVVREFTDDHPARIRASVRNVSDRSLTPRYGFPLFVSLDSPSSSDGVLLIPVTGGSNTLVYPIGGGEPVPDAPDGCWTVEYDYAVAGELRWTTLASGEVVDWVYDVLGHKTGDCLPTGEFTGVRRVDVVPGETHHDGTTDIDYDCDAALRFGLSLSNDRQLSVPFAGLDVRCEDDD